MQPTETTETAASPRGHALPWLLAAVTFLFHLLTIEGYGYFRDELYYLACGEHLGFGYVDHPPLIGLIAAGVRLFGESLLVIRLPVVLAAAATVWLAAATARELGGGRFAQLLAGTATMLAPVYLALASFLSMNIFDLVFWAAGWWLLARILRTGEQRLWLAFGAVTGLGLENKISVLFLGFGLVVGLLLARRWEVFRGRWLWLGGALALALFLPHLLWQVAHGWPTFEFMDNAMAGKIVALPPLAFLGEQVLHAGPPALPVVLAGLAFFLLAAAGRPFRPLGWAYLAVLMLLMATHAKPYYLAPAHLVLFAGGAVAIETWTARRHGTLLRGAAFAAVLLGGAGLAPLGKPLLPVETFVRYAERIGIEASAGENHEMGRLPQMFADMHGWPELAETVAGVYGDLTSEERERACIFGQNYGQAGAIDLFGAAHGLPKAISAHNSYFLWGPGDCSGEVMLVIGGRRERLEEIFEHVEHGTTYTCTDCMPYENHKAIWVARGLRMPIDELWPRIRSYG